MEMDWWRKRGVMASNRERNGFRWDWSSRRLVCSEGTAGAGVGRTGIDSAEVSRQDFSNSVDGVNRSSSSSIGTRRRGSEVASNQPVKLPAEARNGQHRPLRSAERKRGGISPLDTDRRISSTHVDPELPALRRSSRLRSAPLQVPQQSQTENRKRKHPSSVSTEPVSSSPGSSSAEPSSTRSTGSRRSQGTERNMHPSSVSIEPVSSSPGSSSTQPSSSISTRSRRSQVHPSSVSVEPVSSTPGSSSTQPSSSRSTRSRRDQGTDRSRQVESDEMLARQLQQELYNEMREIANVVDANASVAWQNQAPRRTDGGGAAAAAAAAAARRADANILQIQLIERDFNENDYEMLLALDENNHQHSGASKIQISSLPQSVIQNNNDDSSSSSSSHEDPCAICRDVPAVGDAIRHLPCSHKFHKDCIDTWLERKPLCPICKSDVREPYQSQFLI